MNRDTILGRVFRATHPEDCIKANRMFTPMLKGTKWVERIFNEVQSVHCDETPENRRLIFIATIYQVYCPVSYLKVADGDKVAGKLPAGIRDEMKRCLELNSAELVNHYRTFTIPQMNPFNTGPERPFKVKVQSVVDKFRQFSVNVWDTQYEMFA